MPPKLQQVSKFSERKMTINMAFFPAVLLLFCVAVLASSDAAVLPPDEVSALREIGASLNKRDWDFTVDPCSGLNNWVNASSNKDNRNAVTCDCSFLNSTVCHVTGIVMKVQNLSGTLPPTLTKLPFLQELDLTRNFLNGTIPAEWGSMQLVNISVIGNRLTGPIPKELGNISTLVNVSVDGNLLSGRIPPELGNLSKSIMLSLSSNYFTGELPQELAKLTTLKDFRINDNQFNGSIPSFIQNWTNLTRLSIQASGLSGPIPPGIASLTKLTDLRISDLYGNGTTFPPISGALDLKTLVLRSCNITGQLPDYLGSMTKLTTFDLSFNKLTGPIPGSYSNLWDVDFIFLSGNMLSGELPDWVLNAGHAIDLSYNNFSGSAVMTSECQPRQTNLFASSSEGNTSHIVSCLSSFGCPKTVYSLHINCGGREVTVDGTIYEKDMASSGASMFESTRNWAVSSTGNFLDNNLDGDSYVLNSSFMPGNDVDLYRNARLSPLSLTYYGFCMGNGNYTVNLHFAEIMFTEDRSYTSLGRRIFDIYIQGKLVRKDFNIKDEAGGNFRPIVRKFTAVVKDNTLDIRFFWSGKGTTLLPVRGVYGPLISAISIEPDFKPPPENGGGVSAGAIVGAVIAVLAFISAVLIILWWKGCFINRDTLEYELRGVELQTGSFTLRQIKAATKNFDPANKIGEGGFGPVYKGDLGDGNIIAVKQLSSKSKQGNREFVNEIGMISALQHPNLVKLYGCCIEGNQLLLVYEYMENNSLARALFGAKEHQLEIDWPTRRKICIAVARGLAYLHEESRLKIVHRDIKATNVLLDKDLNPKISDFGLAKLDDEENTHISTRIAGTFGYMAPEYAMRGYLTDKADVYSFGVVLLEIVSGRSNTSISPKEDCFYILDWANQLNSEGNLMDLVDARLGLNYNGEEVMRTLQIALMCASVLPADRPSMSSVVSMLEGRAGFFDKKKKNKVKPLEVKKHKEISADADDSQISTNMQFTASSTSDGDLYPITMDTEYLENRL